MRKLSNEELLLISGGAGSGSYEDPYQLGDIQVTADAIPYDGWACGTFYDGLQMIEGIVEVIGGIATVTGAAATILESGGTLSYTVAGKGGAGVTALFKGLSNIYQSTHDGCRYQIP